MRILVMLLATLALAQCATPEDRRFHVGQSPRALVLIGVAEAAHNTSPEYTMLWRRLEPDGRFAEYDDGEIIEVTTHSRNSVRVRGMPGEFFIAEVEPGTYALDSIFALIRDQRVNYSANGVIQGPERPAFDVAAGEAVYLGIWQADLDDVTAVVRPWRLERRDAEAVSREAGTIVGAVRMRQTQTRLAPCQPRQLNTRSQRQIC